MADDIWKGVSERKVTLNRIFLLLDTTIAHILQSEWKGNVFHSENADRIFLFRLKFSLKIFTLGGKMFSLMVYSFLCISFDIQKNNSKISLRMFTLKQLFYERTV